MTLRPSNAYRWANCSGSDRMESTLPEPEESAEVKEGTAGHYYATEFLQGRLHPAGTITPNGVPIDDDMIEGGDVLIDAVKRVTSMLPDAKVYVETFVEAHQNVHPRVQGTPDVTVVHAPTRYVHVLDFKYGHRYVDEFNNAQGINYIAAVFEALGITDPQEIAGWQIVFTVVQPRYYYAAPVRHWRLTGKDFVPLMAAMGDAARRADDPAAPTKTGPWCQDCRARFVCEALARSAGVSVEMSGGNTPVDISVPAAARQLRTIEDAEARLKAMRTGLEAYLSAEIRAGRAVPGWTLQSASNREVWVQPDSEVLALGDAYGHDLRKIKPMTPGQARKAGLDDAVIGLYAERRNGELKLSRVDPRSAAKAFGNG